MYRINKWKLALIVLIFVFSGLYLLPTIPGVYERLYGYFDIWMQDKIPSPDIKSDKDGYFVRFVIPEDDLPPGRSVQEASDSIQDIVGRRLTRLGIGEEEMESVAEENTEEKTTEDAGISKFSFRNAVTTDLHIRFTQAKSKPDLEDIISKLKSGENLLLGSAELSADESLGDIKLSIAEGDLPEDKNMQEAIKDTKDKLQEQLEALELKIGDDFSFNTVSGHELHLEFSPQKSESELRKTIRDLDLYGSIPLVLRAVFPDNPLKQGLDLKGGLHIVLELDVKKAIDMYLDDQVYRLGDQEKEGSVIFNSLKREKIYCRSVEKTLEKTGDYSLTLRPYAPEDSGVNEIQYIADMKRKLREIGVAEDIEETSDQGPELKAKTNVQWHIGDLVDVLLGGNNPLIVTITIPQRLESKDREDYLKTADKVLDRLELFDSPRRLSVKDSVKDNVAVFSVQISEDSAKDLAEDNLDTVMETLENRINKFGLAESSIRRVRGRPRILIQIPEEQNPAKTLAAIKSPGILEFKLVEENPVTGEIWFGGEGTTEPSPDEIPEGAEVRQHINGGWYVLDSEAFMHGTDLKGNSATVRRGEFGMPEVIMYLTRDGQGTFSEFTGQHIGDHTAILLDQVIQSAPRITEKISSSSARITGDFTEEEADYLARILRAGAFPAPMKSAEERIVGPTLGEDAIRRGKIAFTIGVTLVIGFMLFYYKWSGAIAVTALLFNFQIIMGVLAGFGATLTLPGMAGLILTIGMSVDANVLIFERIRDELRSGKTVRSSIDSGYQKAFWTILDANVTTFLTAIVLYEFGTGPIKGFAVTLAIGIMASMFTALVFTREVYRWALGKRAVARLSI